MQEVWLKARSDLTFRPPNGECDLSLWEHAERAARSSQLIFEMLGSAADAVDNQAMTAAALYHCAGWVVQYEEGSVERSAILSQPLSDLQRELSAARATESLESYLSKPRLEAVCTIIRESGRRETSNVGAQIIADATNLDEFGPLALLHRIRRHSDAGLGVKAILATWNRQLEYNFWHARIKHAFNFEVVRRIAERRLQVMEGFMNILANHIECADLKAGLGTLQAIGSASSS